MVAPYIQEEEEQPLEPLRMEHFYLPLILWLAGLILAALTFILELIVQPREGCNTFSNFKFRPILILTLYLRKSPLRERD